jgi:hypothetical protein
VSSVVVDAPTRSRRRLRPQSRSVGVAHAVAALALVSVLAFGPLKDCSGTSVNIIPAGLALASFVALASVAMLTRMPRTSAIAPALALGAALPLLGRAMAGWQWLSTQPCVGNVLDREVVTLLIVTASAAAVAATALWLLVSRDEIEPWYGATGVVVATAGAMTVLVLGAGYALLLHGQTPLSPPLAGVIIPWAVIAGLTGWLRPSPAVAIAIPAFGQALWLLLR